MTETITKCVLDSPIPDSSLWQLFDKKMNVGQASATVLAPHIFNHKMLAEW